MIAHTDVQEALSSFQYTERGNGFKLSLEWFGSQYVSVVFRYDAKISYVIYHMTHFWKLDLIRRKMADLRLDSFLLSDLHVIRWLSGLRLNR